MAFPWDVQEYEGNIYREDMDYVDDYTHDYDPVLVDSDYDQSFRGVSSPSYSHMTARKEIWKWLKTLRVTFMMVIVLKTTLQIYQDLSNAECDL